jgi:hypothetical protein
MHVDRLDYVSIPLPIAFEQVAQPSSRSIDHDIKQDDRSMAIDPITFTEQCKDDRKTRKSPNVFRFCSTKGKLVIDVCHIVLDSIDRKR